MKNENVHRAFKDLVLALDTHASRIAIVERDGSTYTYSDFKMRIVGAQKMLREKGVRKGSKILVFVPMSVDLYAILEAIFSLGATAIFLDPWMKGRKMSQVIRQVKPDLFVVTKKINRIARLLPVTWFLKKWIVTNVVPQKDAWQIESVADSDNALITFTSGTSGQPKGANRTFAFLHAQSNVLKSHLVHPAQRNYVELTNFPIVALADFAMGNTVVIPDVNLMKIHQADSQAILEQLKKNKVNRLIVSPALLNRIISQIDNPADFALEEIVTGGAPISNTLLKQCVSKFPNIKLEAIYGSTEAEPIALTSFSAMLQEAQQPLNGIYTGVPVDAIQVKIIALKTGPVLTTELSQSILPDGKIGEVIVTGDHVNKNYFENEAAFVKHKIVDANGEIWHRTGDVGYLKNGGLYLVGRDHRVMKTADGVFYPYPLEQFVEQTFGFTDIGYLQNREGKFILHIGNCKTVVDFVAIISKIRGAGYPIDEVKTNAKPLPRDARHQSKLQIEDLI